jgi:hypothetical protein
MVDLFDSRTCIMEQTPSCQLHEHTSNTHHFQKHVKKKNHLHLHQLSYLYNGIFLIYKKKFINNYAFGFFLIHENKTN